MLDWSNIDTVLLDMDGTILDLHYDSYFWLTHLPLRYSQHHQISIDDANDALRNYYEAVQGTLEWYCLDYWAEKTQLPIKALKKEVQHLISLRNDAHDFLVALKQSGRRVVLVTNAHPDSLTLKIEKTNLDQYFDHLYSTHEFGASKESQQLWEQLHAKEAFSLEKSLFVDDSLPILHSAQTYGFKHLLAIANPDSTKPHQDITEFISISNYSVLINDVLNNPIKRTRF